MSCWSWIWYPIFYLICFSWTNWFADWILIIFCHFCSILFLKKFSLKPMLKYYLIYHDTFRSCVHLVVYHYTGPTFFTSHNLKLFSEFVYKTLFSVLPLFFLRINTSQKRLNAHLQIQLKHFINLASPNIKLWPFDRV